MRITRRLVLAMAFVASSAEARAQVYTFQNIADTSMGLFSNFGHFPSADDGAPALNNAGRIAFWAVRNGGPGVGGMFTISGGVVTPIAETTSGTIQDFGPRRPAMNASGQVAFYANLTGGGSGVFSGNGGGLTTIADTNTAPPSPGTGTLSGFSQLPGINNAGVVGFAAQSPATGGGTVKFVLSGNGGAFNQIANSSGNPGFFSAGNYVSINSGGTVAFRGTTPDGTDFHRILAGNGGALTTIMSPVGTQFANGFGQGTVPINASGSVAFHAFLDAGGEGIFRGNGGAPIPIADTSGPYSSFFADPSLNALDAVVFQAFLDAGGYGIFTGADPATSTVIRLGDALFGSTVTALNIGGSALNDAGQIAFYYNLADGRNGIALATPVPEPASLALTGLGLGSLIAVQRRKRLTR